MLGSGSTGSKLVSGLSLAINVEDSTILQSDCQSPNSPSFSFSRINDYNMLYYMFKMMTGKTKVDFREWFSLAPVRQGAGNTRGIKGYLNVEVWNSLPDSVKKASTVNSFKSAYDEHRNGLRQN